MAKPGIETEETHGGQRDAQALRRAMTSSETSKLA
jgi:hypothetical protein